MPVRAPIETTYTLTADPKIVVRDVDGAFIPDDPANLDYAAYRDWLAQGNTPKPHTPPGAAKPAVRPAARPNPPPGRRHG